MTSCTDICRSVLVERILSNTVSEETISNEFFEHKNYIYNLLKSTILNGENNSAMVIGPRASGKTMVCAKAV